MSAITKRSSNPTPIDDVISKLPADQRKALQSLREIVLSIIPDAEEVISYGVLRRLGVDPSRVNLILDVDLNAPAELWVRNNLARIEAGLSLHLGGDLVRPELTGRVWLLEGGTIRFRGVEYRVQSGSVDLMERDRFNPYMDIRAETRVKQYDVFLRLEGPLDKLDYEFTSSPSLPTQEILAMLITGSEPTTTSQSLGGSGGFGLTTEQAASTVAGELTEPLSRKVEQSLGLETFQINPMLVQGQADSTTRITVGKRVTQSLRLIYSADLGSTENNMYRAEWEASRKVRFGVARETTGAISGEVEWCCTEARSASPGRPPGFAAAGAGAVRLA